MKNWLVSLAVVPLGLLSLLAPASYAMPPSTVVTVLIPKNIIEADNACSTTVRAHVTNQYGQNLSGYSVSFSAPTGVSFVGGVYSATTDSDGNARVQIKGNVTGHKTITATCVNHSGSGTVTLTDGSFTYGAHTVGHEVFDWFGPNWGVDYYDSGDSFVAWAGAPGWNEDYTINSESFVYSNVWIKNWATWHPTDASLTVIPPGWQYERQAQAGCSCAAPLHPSTTIDGIASVLGQGMAPAVEISWTGLYSEPTPSAGATTISSAPIVLDRDIVDSDTAHDYDVTLTTSLGCDTGGIVISASVSSPGLYVWHTDLALNDAELRIATTSLPSGLVNQAYEVPLDVEDGTRPYAACTISTGSLPPGLSLSDNTISGTPTTTGTYTFTVAVHDSSYPSAASASRQLTIVIDTFRITTPTSLPNGTLGVPYSATLASVNGTSPVTWNIQSGQGLPPGLTLSGNTISGTPTAGGTFGTIIEAHDGSTPSQYASKTHTIYIYEP